MTYRVLLACVLLFTCCPALAQSPIEDAILERVPSDALAIFATPDMPALLDDLGRAVLIEAFPEPAAEATGEIEAMVGVNLLEPSTWGELGIDASGPMGFAWLTPESVAFFWSMEDRAALTAKLEEVSARVGGAIIEEPRGDGSVVLRAKGMDAAALWLSDSHAILYVSDEDDAEAVITRALAVTPDASLRAHAELEDAITGLAPGALHGFIDLKALLSLPLQLSIDRNTRRLGRLRAELEQARKINPQEVASVSSDIEWRERSLREDKELLKIFGRLIGERAAVGVSARIEGASLLADFRVRLDTEGGLVHRLVRGDAITPSLFTHLGAVPMFGVEGALDLDAWLEMVALFMQVDGVEPEAAFGVASKTLGVDLKSELVPALTGTAGFALTIDLEAAFAGAREDEAIGGALLIGVSDPEVVGRALENLSQHPELAPYVERQDAGWIFNTPDFRPVSISLDEGWLAITPDAALLKRLSAGEATPISESTGVQELALAPDASITFAIDWMSYGGLFFAFDSHRSMAMAASSMPKNAPNADAIQKKEAEIQALEQEREELWEDFHEERQAIQLRMMKRGGPMVLSCHPTEGGHDCSFGLFFNAPSIPDFTLGLVSDTVAIDTKREAFYDKERALNERIATLRSEIEALYSAEPNTP